MQEQHEPSWQDGSEVFYVLKNQKIVVAEKQMPETFYIKGLIEDGQFIPKSSILGTGDLGKTGRYGWLELRTGSFNPMESPVKAVTPFVKGYMTDRGFVPSVREVFDEP